MRLACAAALVAACVAALLWWPRASDAPPADVRATAEAARPPAPPSEPFAEGGPPRDAPPASLRDTEVDGALAIDGEGRFVATREALALFDYFLSASGEEPAERIRARIEQEITRRLPPAAAAGARELLARHLAFREAVRGLVSDDALAASADLERRLQWLRELRREHYGAELAQTLFGDEERAVELAIERRRVASDPSLSAAERAARLEALEQALPEATRAAREAATVAMRLAEQERAVREAGGGDAEVRALRERAVGPEAADRLAGLDARRAAWEGRLAAYREERAAIDADAALDPLAREAAVEALLARHFDARERIRVRALDEMRAAEAPATPE